MGAKIVVERFHGYRSPAATRPSFKRAMRPVPPQRESIGRQASHITLRPAPCAMKVTFHGQEPDRFRRMLTLMSPTGPRSGAMGRAGTRRHGDRLGGGAGGR